MSKGPPPPIKPKPRNLPPVPAKKPNIVVPGVAVSKNSNTESKDFNEDRDISNIISLKDNLRSVGNNVKPLPPSRTSKAAIDSVISKPISMSLDPDLSSDDEKTDEHIDESKPDLSSSSTNIESFQSPLKPGVSNKYPIPPKRNAFAVATAIASPLRNKSNDNIPSLPARNVRSDSRETIDYAEGMRSPLKKDTKSVLSSFPPPPKKNVVNTPNRPKSSSRKTNYKSDDESYSEDDNGELNGGKPPPRLPVRRSKSPKEEGIDENLSDSSSSPPKLPNRRRKDTRLSSADSESGRPRLPSRRVSSNHSRSSNMSRRGRDVEYSSDEEESSYNNKQKNGSSSQLLSNAKSFSKESFNTAKEKSGPLARQAMGGLNKMKNKIKNGISNKSDDDFSDSDDYDDYDNSKYRRTPNRSRSSGRNKPSRNIEEDSDDENENVNENENEQNDISIDEDRPPLPNRKGVRSSSKPIGIPLPGLTSTKDYQQSKPKPVVGSKPKPPIPVKKIVPTKDEDNKSKLVPPQPPVSRLRSSSASSNTSSIRSSSNPPPAPPSRNKAPAAPPSRNGAVINSWKKPELDLELSTLWFLDHDGSKLPKCFKGLSYQLSYGYVGTKVFSIYAIRLPDLSTVKLKLVWKKDSPVILDSLTNEMEFTPPPTTTKQLLVDGNKKYGEHVANWCEVKEGQCVGNGECWTLARDALEKACGKHAFVSTGLNHGAVISTFTGMGDNNIPKVILPPVTDEICRGDILQFKTCTFKYPNRTVTYGEPDHTAIVLDVKDGDNSNENKNLKWLEIIQQNMGGVKKVRVGDLDLGKLTEGEIKVFRPVDADWIVDLAEVVL